MKIVIRAGGHGTRLWPLSRRRKPKQFHKILGDKTLLRQTFERVFPCVKQSSDIFVSVNEEYVEALAEVLPEIPSENYILEPEVRNTGPAIALETAFLLEHGVDKDEMIATLPSDDFVSNEKAFHAMLQDVEKFLKKHDEFIVAPSAIPSVPSDGYSYMSPGELIKKVHVYDFNLVADWVEKPSQAESREMINSGRYFAHTGMYMWQLGTSAKLFKKFQKDAWEKVEQVVQAMKNNDGSKVHETYNALPKQTIESFLIHHVTEIATVSDKEMGWSDVGKWQIVKHLKKSDKDNSVHHGAVVTHKSSGNFIMAPDEKVVAVVGMEDVVIVDTEDALLVCTAEQSGDIKDVLKKVEKIEKGRFI